jgi:hypothetical protein
VRDPSADSASGRGRIGVRRVNPSDVPAWVQAGGVLAFATAVWLEQRGIRRSLEKLTAHVHRLLERERQRDGLRDGTTPPLGVAIVRVPTEPGATK